MAMSSAKATTTWPLPPIRYLKTHGGTLDIHGLSSSVPYFKDALDKLDVNIQVFKWATAEKRRRTISRQQHEANPHACRHSCSSTRYGPASQKASVCHAKYRLPMSSRHSAHHEPQCPMAPQSQTDRQNCIPTTSRRRLVRTHRNRGS